MNSEKLLAEAKEVVRDLSVRELIEASIRNGEGTFSDRGALRVTTGTHTGRSPKDKFIVDTPLTHDIVNWDNNQACTEETFNRLYAKCEKFIKTHRVYVKNVKAGADPSYQIRVKFINEMAGRRSSSASYSSRRMSQVRCRKTLRSFPCPMSWQILLLTERTLKPHHFEL